MTEQQWPQVWRQKLTAKKEQVRLWLDDSENRHTLVPYIIFGVLAILCYIFFCYHDILVTAQHSYIYLEGNILDYYSGCFEAENHYGSNYLPSTFILFAIWNLPLKLFGAGPAFFGDWGFGFTLWNKLLPTIFYFASACVLYRLANEQFHFGQRKATLTAMMLLMSPYAFFSQFMFCQYDSFVIFFMLLGMRQYFAAEQTRKSRVLFALFFGIATTFKYFSAVIYLVLLLLKEKNILKILYNAILFALPVLLEMGVYLLFDRYAFMQSVFNFGALDYTGVFGIPTAFGTVNLIYLSLILLIACTYFTHPKSEYDLLGWFSFYSCGVCFVFFGLMSWHPQWLLFAVPFWTIGTMINRRWDLFMLIDSAAAIVFNIFIANNFYHQADETLFRYGVLSDKLQYKLFSDYSVSNLFGFNDKNLLLTLLATVFLVFFIFKHPRFNMEQPDGEMPRAKTWITARFLCGTLSLIIPAFICLPSFLSQDDLLWASYSDADRQGSLTITTDSADFCQYFTTEGSEISQILIQTELISAEIGSESWQDAKNDEAEKHTLAYLEELYRKSDGQLTEAEKDAIEAREDAKNERNALTLELFDAASDTVLGTATVYNNEIAHYAYTVFEFESPISISANTVYGVRISALRADTVRVSCGSLSMPNTLHYNTVTQDYTNSTFTYCGESSQNIWILMNIHGKS